ncbi:acetyl-CoA C-acyltransferase [Heyndrickxia sp. NPDC080065]|uniref:acetyl-CoA C-acyltransferase n=1 Tax=Heyndrickxia sp. NPDC080065 TaxID=3390568 RepID=UPI003D082258
MKKAVIVKAKRTPIGRENGILSSFQPHELAAPLLQHLAKDIETEIDDVIVGNIVGLGGNIARLSALEAGLPLTIPGMTIDRQCSAGLEAIRTACYFVQGGAGKCYLAGGVESTSTSPFKNRAQFSPVHIGDPDMGVAAEYVAEKYRISRERQDEYAFKSYLRSINAYELGFYQHEILKLNQIETDEEFFRRRDMKKLLKRARPIFKKEAGTVTAANSCGIHDGACAVLIMEENFANQFDYEPVLRFVDSQVSGVHPNFPGFSPAPAIQELLKRNELAIEDIDLIEINEAFASKIVACAQELSIPYEKLNVLGGALTLGHPYGASGAILVTRLFYEVQRRSDITYAIAAIGSGGGVGLALLFEVVRKKVSGPRT